MSEKPKLVSATALAQPVQKTRPCWFDALPPEQQAECRKAREQIRASGAALRPIAIRWVQDLQLPVSAQTVCTWMRSNDG